MNYKKFIENMDSDIAFEKITDEAKIEEYIKLLEEKKLPEDIFYKEFVSDKFNPNTNQYEDNISYEFLRLRSAEEIDLLYKIQNSDSFKSIAGSLNFFKILTIIFLVIMIVFIIISLI